MMGTRMHRLSTLTAAALLLAGCVAPDTVRNDDPQINALSAQLAANPKDQQTRVQLIDAYLKRLGETKQDHYRDQAIDQLRLLIAEAPEHTGANITLYQLLLGMSLQERTTKYLAEMRAIYQRTPILTEAPIAPPSLVEGGVALQKVRNEAEVDQTIRLIRQALKENPRHIGTRLLLADLYAKRDKDALALAMYQQAYQLAPDNPNVLEDYGNHLYKSVRAHRCEGGYPQLDTAIGVLKQASAKKPKDTELHYRLSKLYEMRGRPELALFTAKRLDDTKSDLASREYLAERYAIAGRKTESTQMLRALIAEHPDDAELLNALAHTHFQFAEWAPARDVLLQYIAKTDKPSPYAVMLLSITDRMLADQATADGHLNSIPAGAFERDWERALVNYLTGELGEHGLAAAAKNTCDQVEAHYFMGFNKWLARDRDGARAQFEKVIALNVPFYFEHRSSQYLLDHLDEATPR